MFTLTDSPTGLLSLEELLRLESNYLNGTPPPTLRKLMGVGPVVPTGRVMLANSLIIDHLGGEIGGVIDNIRTMGRYVVQDPTATVFGVCGPGSGAMEMCIANLISSGDEVLVCVTGVFSGRMAIMAERAGATVHTIEVPLGEPIQVEDVADQLADHPNIRVVMLVQGETSTGVENVQLKQILQHSKEMGCLNVVDTVCTMSALPFLMKEWGADAVFTGGQKSIGAVPGMSLAFFSEEAMQHIRDRPEPPVQWCLDAKLAFNFWGGKHGYHYTAPVPNMLALHEALNQICQEGLEQRWKRHRASSHSLVAGLIAMGLEPFTDSAHRLHTALAIRHPDGLENPDAVKETLYREHNTVVAGGFSGLPTWRVGQMDTQAMPRPTKDFLVVLADALRSNGWDPRCTGVEAYENSYRAIMAEKL